MNPILDKDFLKSKYLIKDKIQPRSYQIEIASHIIGKNYLVTIPTSLGKTIIAVLTAAKTLEISPDDSKVIFLAPTKPLVMQQAKSFYDLMNNISNNGENYQDSVLTGSIKPEKRLDKFNSLRILFYTPQTLRNDLLSGSYSLNNVSLIIFDEAHKASGNYAYVEIAKLYNEINPDGNILALTASPGSNKEKISMLCQNLHIPLQNIEIRSRKDKDVIDYVHKIELKYLAVEMTEIMEEIRSKIIIMKEKKIRLLNELLMNLQGFPDLYLFKNQTVNIDNKINRVTQKTILNLNRNIQQTIKKISRETKTQSNKILFQMISLNAELLKIFHMQTLVETYGLDNLSNYISTLLEDAKKGKSKAAKNLVFEPILREIIDKLTEIQANSPLLLTHPKTFRLQKILTNRLEINPNLRTLIFVDSRESILTLATFLKEVPKARPVKFVGQAKRSKKDKGLSQKEQIALIDEFKCGKYNILIATSVAEEGLDISECDLVVFYNISPSEIKLIQRMGRTARSHTGEVIILFCRDTIDERYIHIANARKKAMYKNLGKSENHDKKKGLRSEELQQNSRKTTGKKANTLKSTLFKKNHRELVENQRHTLSKDIGKKTEDFSLVPNIKNALITIKFTPSLFEYFRENDKIETDKKIESQLKLVSAKIRKELSNKYGLRKFFTKNEIKISFHEDLTRKSFNFPGFKPDVSLNDKILFSFWDLNTLRHYIEKITYNNSDHQDILRDIMQFKEFRQVKIVFLDFLDVVENQSIEIQQLLKQTSEIERLGRLLFISIFEKAELEKIMDFILNNIVIMSSNNQLQFVNTI